MKLQIIKFIMTVTFFSFLVVTKWCYISPIDARQTLYWVFPFAFAGEGWSTSGALQLFLHEGLANSIIHFTFCFLLTYALFGMLVINRIRKLVSDIQRSIAFLFNINGAIIGLKSYSTINIKRSFARNMINPGCKIVWQKDTQDEE